MDFVGPINPPRKIMGARYINTTIDYLMIWDEETPVKDCTTVTITRFYFDDVVTRFVYPKIWMRDQGAHFFNQTIQAMKE